MQRETRAKAFKIWEAHVLPMTKENTYLNTYIKAIEVELFDEIACVRIGYVMGVLHKDGLISTMQGKKIMTEFYAALLPEFDNPYKPYEGRIDWVE